MVTDLPFFRLKATFLSTRKKTYLRGKWSGSKPWTGLKNEFYDP